MFHYYSGEEVRVGDIVRFGAEERLQRVDKIIVPRTPEAEAFLCYEIGGFLVEPSAILFHPPEDIWEDLEFVARASGEPPSEP